MKLNNNALQELYDTLVSGNLTISPYAESPINTAFRECDEKIQKDIDILENSNNSVIDTNMKLLSERRKLEKEIEDLLSRTHHAEDEINELKTTLEKVNADRSELQNDRDFYHGLYTELGRDYYKLFEENKQIKKELHTAEEARNNLRAELEAKVKRMDEITKDRDFFFRLYHALKNDYKKLEAKYRDMKSYSNCYAEGYSDGKEEGEENLWDMLQTVKDMKPEEFDPECETLGDIIDMDLEDFLDAFKNWQEEKEKNRLDRMRDYLARFCEGRVCEACPLGSNEYKCGCGYSFKKATVWGSKIIPDEELEKYYKRAWHGDANAEKIKEACDAFCEGLKAGLASEAKEVPVSCDIPIKDLASWECTIEAKVEINKDLLEKVCGVKPDEEAHKLEYGDAVRLPWRDHDYMYIGPDGEEGTSVRMFDPKNHAIATTHISNVRYNGGRILVSEEDDIRKIWKYMK